MMNEDSFAESIETFYPLSYGGAIKFYFCMPQNNCFLTWFAST